MAAIIINAGNVLERGLRSANNVFAIDSNSIELAGGRNSSPILPLHVVPMQSSEMRKRASQRDTASNATRDSISIEVARSLDIYSENDITDIADELPAGVGETTTSEQVPTSRPDEDSPAEKAKKRVIEQKRIDLEYEKCGRKIETEGFEGIPLLSRFQCSSDAMEMFRLFKLDSLRVLNQMQLEINQLSKELAKLDLADTKDPKQQYRLHGAEQRPDRCTRQKQLLDDLKNALKEYQDFLLKYKQLSAMNGPQDRSHKNLFTFIVNKRVLREEFIDIIYEKRDYICLTDSHTSYLETQLQSIYNKDPSHYLKFLVNNKELDAQNDNQVVATYYSKSRLRNLGRAFSVCLVVGILLAPVFILFLVPMARGFMALTASAFLVLFAVMLSFMTESKLEVVFIGTATYGAVLIMFLGNINEGNLFIPH